MPAHFKRFAATRKIRRVSVDTNVISKAILSVLPAPLPLNSSEAQQSRDSFEALMVILTVAVTPMGIPMVRRELSRRPLFAEFYDIVFDKDCEVPKDVTHIADAYQRETRLRAADAVIAATAAYNRIDVLLTWDKADLLGDHTQQRLREINLQRGIPHPIFATPSEFLSRLVLTDDRTLMLTSSVVPPGFRPRSSLSR